MGVLGEARIDFVRPPEPPPPAESGEISVYMARFPPFPDPFELSFTLLLRTDFATDFAAFGSVDGVVEIEGGRFTDDRFLDADTVVPV